MNTIDHRTTKYTFYSFCNKSTASKANSHTDNLKRISLIILNILIFLATLGIAHTIYYCMENHKEAMQSSSAKQCSDLRKSISVGDQTHLKVKKVKKKFISDNIEKEVMRLNKTLDNETKRKLNNQYFTSVAVPSEVRERHTRFIFGRALAIKDAVKDKNYFFLHGHKMTLLPIIYLNDALVRLINGKKHSGFHYLRFPSPTNIKKNNLAEINDRISSEDLLSVDPYFFNDNTFESNGYFLVNNTSINQGEMVIQEYVEGILRKINPNFDFTHNDYPALISSFKSLCDSLSNEPVGVLNAICVPKETMKDQEKCVGYRSHPFGVPCLCVSKDDAIKSLEELQNNKVSVCSTGKNPQYRLFAKELSPDPSVGVRIYLISHLGKERKKMIKESVATIAKGFLKIAQLQVSSVEAKI